MLHPSMVFSREEVHRPFHLVAIVSDMVSKTRGTTNSSPKNKESRRSSESSIDLPGSRSLKADSKSRLVSEGTRYVSCDCSAKSVVGSEMSLVPKLVRESASNSGSGVASESDMVAAAGETFLQLTERFNQI